MRTGKISENVLKRSVLKRCHAKKENMVQGPGVGRDCAIFHIEGKKQLITSVSTVIGQMESGKTAEPVRQGICHAANDLLCGGGIPLAVSLSVTLPVEAEESLLREIMDSADSSCAEIGIALSGGHTTVTGAVSAPVIGISAVGTAREQQERALVPGLDLVMTGWAGMEGTALLAREREEQLRRRFSLDLVATAQTFDRKLYLGKEAQIAWDCQAAALHDVSEGGIFGALWEFCESQQVGLEAELKKIPLKQETVEICELLGLNPYCLLSGGALLAAVPDGQRLMMELSGEGIPAVLIGRTTEKKEKVLRNGEECRFLEKPARDEIWRIRDGEK